MTGGGRSWARWANVAAAQAGHGVAAAAGRGLGDGIAFAWRHRGDAERLARRFSGRSRPADGEALESERLKARLGEMLRERKLLDAKITALEAGRPLARRRRKS